VHASKIHGKHVPPSLSRAFKAQLGTLASLFSGRLHGQHVGFSVCAPLEAQVCLKQQSKDLAMTTVHAGVEIGGQSNILSAVQVAQLALKHRQNKNQRQRIVLFSGRSAPCRLFLAHCLGVSPLCSQAAPAMSKALEPGAQVNPSSPVPVSGDA